MRQRGTVHWPEIKPLSVPLHELRQEVFDNAETADNAMFPIWEDVLRALDELDAWRAGRLP